MIVNVYNNWHTERIKFNYKLNRIQILEKHYWVNYNCLSKLFRYPDKVFKEVF
jgi:hypothetical protein